MSSPTETGSTPGDAPLLPDAAGYRLLERLGEGGMGIVYKAEQLEPVKRTVALKIIRRGMDSKDVLARFDAERQALAMMDHPHIAKVFDAGETDAGVPYFVMELVGGEPLTEYCENNQLDKNARLELFIAICRAVQHAHQKGIIHRDLKPSNILVAAGDADIGGTPKIIDFGIAKAASGGQKLTDRTLFTGFMQIVGTPAYMSPEQAEISGMDIDTRTDIYALGVILYELLTGTLPFDAKRFKETSIAEIERILWEEDPPIPSKRLASLEPKSITAISTSRKTTPRKLLSEVTGELDWVVMKAIEKDRTRRYESATAFAEDVRRHLDNEPVSASPPSRIYFVTKFVKRHRIGIGMAAALVMMMLAGTAVSIWQAKRAHAATKDAITARRDAERESAAAKQNLQINDRMLDFLMNDMLEAGNPLKEIDRDIKLQTVIDRAADRVKATFGEERDIRFAISMTLGRLYSTLGELDKARTLLEDANRLADELWPNEDNRMRAGVKNALGTVAMREGKLDEAEALFTDALAQHIRIFGDDSSYTGYSRFSLGNTYLLQRRYEEAKQVFESSLAPNERILGPHHPEMITLLSLLGETCQKLGLDAEARAYFAQSAERYDASDRVDVDDVVSIDTMNNHATALMHQGDFDEALPILEKVVELSKKSQGATNPLTLISIHNLAAVHLKLGHFEKALPLFREGMEGEIEKLGEEHPNALGSLQDYANCCFRIPSETENGVAALKRMVVLHHRLSGANSNPLGYAYNGLRKWLPELGRNAELVEIERLLTGDVEWPAGEVQSIIDRGTTWRYFDGEQSPSKSMATDFDDSEWAEGAAPLGYGDDDLATTISFGDDPQSKHPTALFRHTFEISSAGTITELKFRLRYDDLAVIYLNGKEIASGESDRNADRLAEDLYYVLIAPADQLRDGKNVLAVAISQANPQSSDLIFDLSVEARVTN